MNSEEWLAKLIAFDTTSRNSNLDLIAVIQNELAAHSIDTHLTYDQSGKKANLFAVLAAENGSDAGGIILSGHTDVVPVDGQQWESDPFIALQTADRIYGRGACDMKGFIAVILSLLPEFLAIKRQRPIYLAFTYDEEVGCLGMPLLLADLMQRGIRPAACIVGEPTEMQPVIAHKGINVFRCRLYGKAVHSSLTTQGCNAIEYAAELISWLHQFSQKIKQEGPFDAHYDVPFTTMTTNVIHGGNAVNIIPDFCEFSFEFRNLPEINAKNIIDEIKEHVRDYFLPKMRQAYPAAKIEIEPVAIVPGFNASPEAEITKLIRAVTGNEKIRKVSYTTEAGLFQQAGISTVLCGPGSIEQAHRANEFVLLEQLKECEIFLRNIVNH